MQRLLRIEGCENKKSPFFAYFETLLIDQPNNLMTFLIASRLLLICGVFNFGFPQLGCAYEQVNSETIVETHGEKPLNSSTVLGFTQES